MQPFALSAVDGRNRGYKTGSQALRYFRFLPQKFDHMKDLHLEAFLKDGVFAHKDTRSDG